MDEKILEKYTNPANPGSFLGINGFLKNNKLISKKKSNFLNLENTVNLHKPVVRKFQRNKFKAYGIDHIWQADLIDMKKLKFSNSHFEYMLTCIDIFSKFAWAIPIKKKTAEATKLGFQKIFEDNRFPEKIHIDQGNEFKGVCKIYLEKLGIETYFTNTHIKASIVERFNRTLKNKLWRYLTFKKSKTYIKDIQKLVDSYNNSYHSSIKTTPAKASKKNEDKTFEILYGDENDQLVNIEFEKGSYVRIAKTKEIFSKGYTENWDKEIYIIDKIFPRIPPIYKIISINGSAIDRSFYGKELQFAKNINFDTFQVIDESNDKILVEKLNGPSNSTRSKKQAVWIDKEKFLSE
jgi:hypothetical protein